MPDARHEVGARQEWCPFTSEEKDLDSPNSRIEKLTRYMQPTRCIKGLQER
jgi:hypothetical protein